MLNLCQEWELNKFVVIWVIKKPLQALDFSLFTRVSYESQSLVYTIESIIEIKQILQMNEWLQNLVRAKLVSTQGFVKFSSDFLIILQQQKTSNGWNDTVSLFSFW